MTAPAVSVVMPVYNGAEYLREAIGSIVEQSFSDLELVVIDDGSTDETPEILTDYAKHDDRLRIDRHERAGLGAALNRGVGLARAPLVARLDADDVALPDRLELQRRFLDDHPSVVVVGGAVRFINERGHAFADVTYPLSDDEIRMTMRKSTPFVHSAVMMRKEAFERSRGYRPAFRDAADVDLWLRLAELGTLANLPELLVCYRMHAGQATVQRRELMTMCALAARVAAQERAAGRPDPVSAVTVDVSPGAPGAGTRVTSATRRRAAWRR